MIHTLLNTTLTASYSFLSRHDSYPVRKEQSRNTKICRDAAEKGFVGCHIIRLNVAENREPDDGQIGTLIDVFHGIQNNPVEGNHVTIIDYPVAHPHVDWYFHRKISGEDNELLASQMPEEDDKKNYLAPQFHSVEAITSEGVNKRTFYPGEMGVTAGEGYLPSWLRSNDENIEYPSESDDDGEDEDEDEEW